VQRQPPFGRLDAERVGVRLNEGSEDGEGGVVIGGNVQRKAVVIFFVLLLLLLAAALVTDRRREMRQEQPNQRERQVLAVVLLGEHQVQVQGQVPVVGRLPNRPRRLADEELDHAVGHAAPDRVVKREVPLYDVPSSERLSPRLDETTDHRRGCQCAPARQMNRETALMVRLGDRRGPRLQQRADNFDRNRLAVTDALLLPFPRISVVVGERQMKGQVSVRGSRPHRRGVLPDQKHGHVRPAVALDRDEFVVVVVVHQVGIEQGAVQRKVPGLVVDRFAQRWRVHLDQPANDGEASPINDGEVQREATPVVPRLQRIGVPLGRVFNDFVLGRHADRHVKGRAPVPVSLGVSIAPDRLRVRFDDRTDAVEVRSLTERVQQTVPRRVARAPLARSVVVLLLFFLHLFSYPAFCLAVDVVVHCCLHKRPASATPPRGSSDE
jgi:hypothetical protein